MSRAGQRKPQRDNGAVIWRGPSLLTGGPIVVVVTGLSDKSRNAKVGDALTAWILCQDMNPNQAVETGTDRDICGDCRLRGDGVHGRGCYVTYWQAALNVWRTVPWRPFVAPEVLARRLIGRTVRLAGYGDPAAVPVVVWATLLSRAGGWVGYTQQWGTCDPGLRMYCMASVFSEAEAAKAQAAGWRTYRVRTPDQPVAAGEIVCPASNEAGHKLTCADCRLCEGAARDRVNVAIIAHGKPGNLKAFGMKPAGGLFGRPAGKVVHLQPA